MYVTFVAIVYFMILKAAAVILAADLEEIMS